MLYSAEYRKDGQEQTGMTAHWGKMLAVQACRPKDWGTRSDNSPQKRAHFRCGFMYYKCRLKECIASLSDGFGSNSQCQQRIVKQNPYCEFIPK